MLLGAQVPAAHEVRKAVAAVVEAQALHGFFGFQITDDPGFLATGFFSALVLISAKIDSIETTH